MCFDALCSVLRRIYGGKEELRHYVNKTEQDPELRDLAGAISYFRERRIRVDHPVTVSTELEAESTFSTTKRLILGI